MAPHYRKIDPRIWDDEKFRRHDPLDKLIAVYILTAQCNRIGLFVFSKALASEVLGIKLETLESRFQNICRAHGWRYDEETRVLYLASWWKYNRPDNPNQLTSCLADLHDLPENPLTEEFFSNRRYLPHYLHPAMDKQAQARPDVCKSTAAAIPFRRLIQETFVANPAFVEAWSNYCRARAEKGDPVVETEAKLKLSDLDAMGIESAVQALRTATASGWKRIVAPNRNDRKTIQQPSLEFTEAEAKERIPTRDISDLEPEESREGFSIWSRAIENIRMEIDPQSFETWMAKVVFISIFNTRIILAAQSEFIAEWVNIKYRDLIERCVADEFAKVQEVQDVPEYVQLMMFVATEWPTESEPQRQ